MTKEIRQNVVRLLAELPRGVKLVAAAKSRKPAEILTAVEAGVRIIGHNYIQEAVESYQIIGNRAQWHFIGHLQKNKVKKAVALFDMIETVDNLGIAADIDRHCHKLGSIKPVLIEINSGREKQKSGVFPEGAVGLIKDIAFFKNIVISGLMTIGAYSNDQKVTRSNFRDTRMLFEMIRELNLPGVEMRYLSMGMSDSYLVALEEGANIVRIGSGIFGSRGT
jgi:pyridoxal phosphate enzyme (YggS family)